MTAKFAAKAGCPFIFFLFALCFSSKAQPSANFTGAPISGCAPLVVNFIDQSTGNPTQWKWDLGNGTISFLQNPSVTYFNPGQYNIKLVAQNASGADSIIKTQFITVYAQPSVAFAGTPRSGCFPLHVQFTDQSTAGNGSIVSWIWDFGDGFSDTVQNPSHTYTAAGNFNISLQVKNSFGCITTLTKAQYIHISSGVHSDFSSTSPNTCTAPATINFQNLSTGTGTLTYQWNFGDGNTSTLTNPSHIYTNSGSYTVQLVVKNSGGCTDTIIKTNTILIGSGHASFTSPDSVCVNDLISFANTSSPSPVSVSWTFGDGNTSVDPFPSKTYSSVGVYVVKMIAYFGGCSDSSMKTITVLPKPTADFSATPLSSCKAPLTVNFTNLSSNAVSYAWYFGDGTTSTQANPSHIYNSTGNFTVTLTVTNAFGCTDSVTKATYIRIDGPHASINNLTRSGCAPLTHTFTATINSVDPVVSYFWDFGDGATSTVASPTHTYPAGTYNIKLIITTAGGCTDTAIVAGGIIASTKPVANFSATPRDACAKVTINFTDLSTSNVTHWFWDFGDGGTSTQQNPGHLYQDTGYFDVTLIVWNNGCPDTIKFLNYIHILPPIANFGFNIICGSKDIAFNDLSLGADEWLWDFGDGNTSTLQNPTHSYADSGIYVIKLTVINHATGCDNVTSKTVHLIDEKARFYASDTVICKGTGILFTAYPNNAANVSSFEWTFGDGVASSGQFTSHVYLQSGIYDVQLIITDLNGCKDTLLKQQYIRVDGPTADFSSAVPGSCLNSAVIFTDNSTDDGTHPVQTWIWAYGDGTIDTLTAPPFQHTYVNPGSFTVSLKVIDSKGCADSVVKTNFFAISKPIADFSSPDTLRCPNDPVYFSNLSSGPGLSYAWDFGDGGISTVAHPIHVYTADGLYTVKLVIFDQYGCTDSMIKSSYIKVNTVHANFTMSDSVSTCPPLVVQFNNTSINSINATWDFGDGTFAQGQTPSHFYSYPGTYNVRLVVTSASSCTDTMYKQIIIRGPIGSFTYTPILGCNPLTVNFVATTQDRVSFIWDYNDGTVISTADSIISHTYTIPGTYLPRMILVDSGGCQVPILGIDTIRVNGVHANFGINSFVACDAGSFNFSDSSISNDVILNYAWTFGDGGTSNLQNPSHSYATAGVYYPRLIVTTQTGCTDTLIGTAPVKIITSPSAGIVNTPSGCTPLTVTFSGNLLVVDTSAVSWSWNFGNGNTSLAQYPPAQIYSNPSQYNIQLIATNSSGCKDTVTTVIDAHPLPTISAGVDTMICKGTGINIIASGANSYTWSPTTGLSCTTCPNPVATPDSVTKYIVRGMSSLGCVGYDTVQVDVKYPFAMLASNRDTLCLGSSAQLFASGAFRYTWSPSTGLSSTTSATPVARPITTTTYMVVGTDDHNCFRDTSYVPVFVYPIPTVHAGADQTINIGQTIDLIPVVSNDVNQVIWSPTGTIFRNIYPGITVKPRETTEYTVEVSNAGGCKAKDKVSVFVVCNGANVFIPNTFSPNGDGANDVFYPRGTGLFSIKSLRIFNRWGEIVFEGNNFNANDASKGWNGTFKGVTLIPDVYVYTIDIICDNSTIMTYKGNVALIQ